MQSRATWQSLTVLPANNLRWRTKAERIDLQFGRTSPMFCPIQTLNRKRESQSRLQFLYGRKLIGIDKFHVIPLTKGNINETKVQVSTMTSSEF